MSMTERTTTGTMMAESLVMHGIDTIFGIAGAHMYDFNDALYGVRDVLRFIHTRHEQGSGYMAYGYAKSTGRVGAYTVVPGPGVLNSGAALCTAYGANAPVLCVTGNIMADLIGRGRGQLHELPDQLALLHGLTKSAERINHPSEVSAVMARAFTRMLSGRQGPASVEAPWDVFGQKAVPTQLTRGTAEPAPVADPDALAAAAALVKAARNPLIMVGGGAVDAAAEVAELSRLMQAPVTAHRSGKGILADDDPYALGMVAAFEYWKGADLLIGIGSRLELQHMRWRWLPPGLKTIRIDIDPIEMVRLKPQVGIVADAAAGTRALIAALGTHGATTDRGEELAAFKARAAVALADLQPQMAFLDAIRDVLPRDGFLVEEISQMGFFRSSRLPVLPASPLRHLWLPGQSRLRLQYSARREGCEPRQGRGVHHRRWRFPVRNAGNGDGNASRHQRRGNRVQQWRLRQRSARPAAELRRPLHLGRPDKSGFRRTRGELRHARDTRQNTRRAASHASARAGARCPLPHRGSRRKRLGKLALAVHPSDAATVI